MNFHDMPELSWKYGYLYAVGLMTAVVVLCMWWFRRKGWIGSKDLDVPDDS